MDEETYPASAQPLRTAKRAAAYYRVRQGAVAPLQQDRPGGPVRALRLSICLWALPADHSLGSGGAPAVALVTLPLHGPVRDEEGTETDCRDACACSRRGAAAGAVDPKAPEVVGGVSRVPEEFQDRRAAHQAAEAKPRRDAGGGDAGLEGTS